MSRTRPGQGRLHGFIVLDKPAGWTSHDVVARCRRLFGERRIGHAGTLDPAATGVLPLAVGDATRVLEFLSDASKSYVAEITFGVETDTYDADGRVVGVEDASNLNESDIAQVLRQFTGEIEQRPPMHSAVKVRGQRLYELARRGEEVVRDARLVQIFQLDLLSWETPTVTVLIDCSKGTYIRALAHDIGTELGVGAYLADLVRTRTGPFSLCDTVTLSELEAWPTCTEFGEWATIAYHPDAVLQDWPVLVLDDQHSRIWINGGTVPGAHEDVVEGRCRVYATDGRWLGVGVGDPASRRWRPVKVIASAA